MSELIVKIHRPEREWPSTTRRTRLTGYGVGVHSIPSDAWERRVEFAGRARIEEAIRRGDLEVTAVPAPKKAKAAKAEGGEA